MDVDDLGEIVRGHLGEGLVAQDTCIVNKDIQLPELLDRHVDHGLCARRIGHAVAIRDRNAASGSNLFDHLISGAGTAAFAVHCPA